MHSMESMESKSRLPSDPLMHHHAATLQVFECTSWSTSRKAALICMWKARVCFESYFRLVCELAGGKVCIAAMLQYCKPRLSFLKGGCCGARHETFSPTSSSQQTCQPWPTQCKHHWLHHFTGTEAAHLVSPFL